MPSQEKIPAQSVYSVSSSCPTCGESFDKPPLACPKDGTILVNGLRPGTVISNCYEYVAPIGVGGMGIIVKAKHSVLDIEVAVKMLLRHSDGAAVRRFQQEAKAASLLTHNNIIQVRDFGITSDGCPFMVMDLLSGQNLSDVLKVNGTLSTKDAISLFIQVCDAMTYAHSKGVVHRDLKPSNIMITLNHKDEMVVKIVDFGIAKVMQSPTEMDLTRTGEIFGSPLYMSPEQSLGKKSDHRTDIYSAGCVLFHVLTGAPPLEGETAMETLIKHVNDQPTTLAEASLGVKFPQQLERIVAKTLEKDPAMRYQSFADLSADLEALEKSIDNPVKPATSSVKPSAHKKNVIGVLVASLMLVGAIGFAFFSWQTRTSSNTVTTLPKQLAESESVKSAKAEEEIQPVPLGFISNVYKPYSEFMLDHSVYGRELIVDEMTNDDIKKIVQGLKQKHTSLLSVVARSKIHFTDDTLKLLVDQPLENLCINKTSVTFRSAEAISKIATLRSLELAKVAGATPQRLKNLGRLKNLEVLDLSFCSNLAAADLAFLPALKNLRELNLDSDTYVGKEVIKYIAQLPKLTTLKLPFTQVADDGLIALPNLKNLKKLYLGGEYVDDETIAIVSNRVKGLEVLYLSNAMVTRRSIPLLAKMPKLKELYLIDCRHMSNNDVVNEVKAVMQNCDVQLNKPDFRDGFGRALKPWPIK